MRVLVTGANGSSATRLRGAGPLRPRSQRARAPPRLRAASRARGLRGPPGRGTRARGSCWEARPECLITSSPDRLPARPHKVEEVNVRGTRRLLDACLRLADGDPARGPRFVSPLTVVTGEAAGALLSEEQRLPVQTPTALQAGGRAPGARVRSAGGRSTAVACVGPGGWYAKSSLGSFAFPAPARASRTRSQISRPRK